VFQGREAGTLEQHVRRCISERPAGPDSPALTAPQKPVACGSDFSGKHAGKGRGFGGDGRARREEASTEEGRNGPFLWKARQPRGREEPCVPTPVLHGPAQQCLA